LPLTLEQAFLGKNLRKPSRASEAVFECRRSSDGKNTPRITQMEVHTPKTLKEALALLAEKPYTVLAGGTDVMIQLRKETEDKSLLNIYHLPELRGIDAGEKDIVIRAMTPITDILDHTETATTLPLLSRAIQQIGSTQIRNRATLAGNLVNAAPCADSVPPLLVYEASVKLQNASSSRIIPVSQFIERNYQTCLADNELLTEIIIPRLDHRHTCIAFHKLGRRNALNITRISAALLLQRDDDGKVIDCRLACGSLFNRPLRLCEVESRLVGSRLTSDTIEGILPALETMIEEAIGGRWSSEYKKPVFLNMIRDLLLQTLPETNTNTTS
jgi:CO/xanthine dehydrogenase FAD-binding subunit